MVTDAPRKSARKHEYSGVLARLAGPRSGKKPDVSAAKERTVLYVAHNHPAMFPGGTEIFARDLHRAMTATPGWKSYFVAATGSVSRADMHPGTAFQAVGVPAGSGAAASTPDGAGHAGGQPAGNAAVEARADAHEWLFWGDRFDYFLQSQRMPGLLSRDFAELLRTLKPDVVHFHHTMRIGLEALPLVRSVLPDAKIVYTLHDFIPMCHRDGQMVRTNGDTLCTQASPTRCHQCFPDIPVQRFALREQFIKTHLGVVDMFLSPSRFLADRYVGWGVPAHKIRVQRNGRDAAGAPLATKGPGARSRRARFGFFGQVSRYKGALVLLEAARLLRAQGDVPCRVDIYGNIGLQTPAFREAFDAALAQVGDMVTFHGAYTPAELPALMAEVDWVVVPSIWWENAPLVIDEAFLYRRPVITSNIGGMAEKVTHEVNGLHFRAADAMSLAQVMRRAAEEPGLWDHVSRNLVSPLSLAECAAEHAGLYAEMLTA